MIKGGKNMQKKKNIAFLLLIVAVCFLVTGCGKKAELEKNSTIVKYDGGKIKAETLYEDLRDKYGISILIDMIDHSILDKKYKTTDEETTYVDNQITQMKSQYNNDDDTFLAAIKQYLGVDSVDELRDMISLEYKRNLAIEDYIKDNQIIVDVAKGIEPDTLFTLTQVIDDEIKNKTVKYVALSGPTHAEEVSRDMPTTIVSACQDIEVAKLVQEFFSSSFMRVYTNTDIKGIEICGALKNIIALATGISRGLGYGDNATAALVTRGLAELSRLGTAIGCSPYTFSGLTGMGDLIVTCTSIHSRNNNAGFLIGQGMSPDEAVKKVGMVVEGINAIPAALKLADKYNVDLPIIFAVNDIINGDVSPQYAVNSLFNRELKAEVELDFPKENY